MTSEQGFFLNEGFWKLKLLQGRIHFMLGGEMASSYLTNFKRVKCHVICICWLGLP